MTRSTLILAGLMALNLSAQAADYNVPLPPSAAIPPPVVPIAPERIQPLVQLGTFWSEVRRSDSPTEVFLRIDRRFGGLPLTFQGINTDTGEFQRTVVINAYRRGADQAIDLPAVTFTTITDGARRDITVPLGQMGSMYR